MIIIVEKHKVKKNCAIFTGSEWCAPMPRPGFRGVTIHQCSHYHFDGVHPFHDAEFSAVTIQQCRNYRNPARNFVSAWIPGGDLWLMPLLFPEVDSGPP